MRQVQRSNHPQTNQSSFIQQLSRGTALISALAGSLLFGAAKATGSLASQTARRAGTPPEVKAAVSPQSTFPGNLFSLSILPSNYFLEPDSGQLTISAVEKEKETLPNWLELEAENWQIAGSYNTAGSPRNVQVIGNLAYVASGNSGLEIIDITNPAAPILTGSYNTPNLANDLQVVGNLAYVADLGSGLQIINVTNPAAPTFVGSYNTPSNAYSLHVVENLAYVADDASGLQIIDVSNPTAPILAGSYNTPGDALGVQVIGNLAYIADGSSGLQIINVTNPASPTLTGSYNTPSIAWGLQIIGDLAYIANFASGLQIINVTNPAAPTFIGSSETSGIANDVQVIGNLAYVADSGSGLQVIDVSNPAAPTVKSSSTTTGGANGLQVIKNLAYIADFNDGLQIFEEQKKLSGVANKTAIGNYEIELIAEDPEFNRATSSFILRVEGPPVATNPIPSQLADVGVPFNFFIDQSAFPDPNNDVVFYSAKKSDQSPLPSWLNFSPIGIFSGTPQTADIGTTNIRVFGHDGIVTQQANSTFLLTVEHFPKLVTAISNQAAATNQSYSYTVPAGSFTDQDVADTLTYSSGSLPSWLTFYPTNRTFSGTPTAGDNGSSPIIVTVTDTPGATASTTFTLVVGEFPSLQNPIPSQLAAVDVPFLYSIPGNTFTTPPGEFLSYTAEKSDGSVLPAWLGFVGPRLEFQGTPQPSDKGSVSLKVVARDSKGGTAESLFNLSIVEALSQEVARIGGSFIYAIPNDMVSAPQGPVTYTVTLGDGSPLPTWLNYNPTTHIISGVPPTGSDGTYRILVTADDGVQAPVMGTLTLNIGLNAAPKVVNPISSQTAQVGQSYSFAVPDNTFADANGDTLTISAKRVNGRELPSWLTFSGRTLIGKPGPGDTGAFTDKTIPLQICATDGDQEACSVFDLSVQGTSNAETAFAILGPMAAVVGAAYGWYNKRGAILNPWNREKYDKGTRSVSIGTAFNYQFEAPEDKIKLVKAFKGRRMLGGLPTPQFLDKRGWLEWMKHDEPILGGNLLPSWLTYNEKKRLLTSSRALQTEDRGLYIFRAYGSGEMILEQVTLDIAGTGDS